MTLHCEYPRDYYNIGRLITCMGDLSLAIHDGNTDDVELYIEHDQDPPEVDHDWEYNILHVTNHTVWLKLDGNDYPIHVGVRYNTRRRYALVTIIDSIEYPMFDESGKFIFTVTDDIKAALKALDD